MKNYTENEIRSLRDAIYGPCKDTNWEACREKWSTAENIAWLEDNQPEKTRQRIAEKVAKIK